MKKLLNYNKNHSRTSKLSKISIIININKTGLADIDHTELPLNFNWCKNGDEEKEKITICVMRKLLGYPRLELLLIFCVSFNKNSTASSTIIRTKSIKITNIFIYYIKL